MDDKKLSFGLLILLIVFFSMLAQATEVEYVSPQQQRELEALFDRATLKAEVLHGGQTWDCDLFGVRSRMQVQHGLQLYTLKDEGDKVWKNTGAQVVTNYKENMSALVGANERFQDEIKVAQDGRLVSRLTLNSSDRPVLAYALCKAL